MTEHVVKDPFWVGRVVPLESTEQAKAYWCSAHKVSVLREMFGDHADDHGPAKIIGATCRRCNGDIVVRIRTDAASVLSCLDQTHGWSGAAWRLRACKDCQALEKKEAEDQARRLFDRRNSRDCRPDRVSELRSMPYLDYLQTQEWKDIRDRALKRAGYACQVCYSNQFLHVHHRTYSRRGFEQDADLTVLCAECHELFHERMKLAEFRDSERASKSPSKETA